MINLSRPIVWSIAASDSGGGAGIQADLNTMHSLDCHGCTIITAITAQNSIAVEKIHPLSAVDLAAQWQALEKDLLPEAIKIGLLPEPNTLRWLVRQIKKLRLNQEFFCVWDPVLKATTGARFLDAFDRGEIDPLLKQVDLITPNLQETEILTKIKIKSYEDITLAAKQLLENGVTFDAICAASDLIAIGAMRAVQEAGYNIPKDIAVVGFDDIATASSTFPAMTTAKQDTVLAGELLVDKLLQLVRGEEAQTQLMPTTLVVRKSCGS